MSGGGVGVLALQGDFAAHVRMLRALVLPGGESTALLRLMEGEPWLDALRAFHARGGALLATCAGVILLAREVSPAQPSLGLLDVAVARNAYGRQVDSFEAEVPAALLDRPLRAVFIRAPRLTAVGPAVEVLGRLDGAPVLVRQGRVIGATFHTEISGDGRLHRQFLDLAA